MPKHKAQIMAESVEKWLGNPATRSILKYVTKRCPKDGRRMERALESYALSGKKQTLEAYAGKTHANLCASCRVSGSMVKAVLDTFLSRTGTDKNEVAGQLGDPVWRKGLASVLEGIAEFGTQKPFTSYAPFLVVWNFTKACNLRCRHCYESASVPAPDELTTEEALAAVDKMADAGVAYIALSGGEPLIRRDFFRIAKRIREREMGFSIATNGTLLTEETAKKLKEHGCVSAQVSLDGASAETHNWFRGADAFERTICGIKNAINEGIIVNVATTVTKHNLKEVPQILGLVDGLGAGFMHYNFIPTGKGKEIVELDLSPQERETLLEYLAGETKKRKITILSTAPQYGRICTENEAAVLAMSHFDPSRTNVSGSLRFLAEFIGGCGTGRLYCALEPNGDITPCVFIPVKLGNIKNDDLLDVWHSSSVLKKIRDRKSFRGNCPVCANRNICGGCRARAYAYFGDVQAPDPGCVRNVGPWAKEYRM